MTHRLRTGWILFVALGLLAPGCSSKEPLARTSVALQKAQSCADLEQLLKQDALVQMNAMIDTRIRAYESWDDSSDLFGGSPRFDNGTGEAWEGGTGGVAAVAPPAGTGGAGNAAPEHSETNVQVEGVDEADIVKTDGNYLYLVHGRSFTILNAWPASDLGLGSSLPIEGRTLEMYVTDDQAVVYSLVPVQPVLDQAGVAARQPFCSDEYGCSYGGYDEDYGYGYYEPEMTKVTVLALAGAQASVLKEYYFEGLYASSRRVGDQVRTVLSNTDFGPPGVKYWPDTWGDNDEMIDALEDLRAANTALIQSTPVEEWLPRRFARVGGGVAMVPTSCEDYYVPTAGTTLFGLTQIHTIDLAALDAPPTHTSVVGATETIYANAASMYLAAPSWDDPWFIEGSLVPISTTLTHLHKLDLVTDPARPHPVASGSVPGTVLNQFSLDEKDGLLRIATTDVLAGGDTWEEANDVFVVGETNGRLEPVGQVLGLAPGETIRSTRFVGDRGYVVTFRQTDPLFVLDLSTPTSPTLLGHLEIPGFSEYMHPLDDHHLLTVGQDGDEWGTNGSLALQIFDVTNGAAPVLTHKYAFPGYGSSEAENNHKAFTYYATLGMLAIPYQSYDADWRTTLELFHIDVTAGIAPAGSVDHTSFFGTSEGYCGGYYDVGVRRGVFIEDYIYSISYGGVRVNAVSDMSQIASLALPDPTSSFDSCVYY